MKHLQKILALLFTSLALLGNGNANAPSFTAEVLVSSRSASWLKEQATLYLDRLPQESGELPKAVEVEADRLIVERSFLVRQKRNMLSHVIADVEYTAVVQIAEGRYMYEFSNFKVFPHSRNRYGKYTRSSSRGKSLDKLGKSLKPQVNQAIQQQITHYVKGLKEAMD